MAVPCHAELLLLNEWHKAARDAYRRRAVDEFRAERASHIERLIYLLVGEIVIEAFVVRENFDTGIIEFLPDSFEIAHRRREPPVAKILAALLVLGRFEHRLIIGHHLFECGRWATGSGPAC